MKKKCKIIMLSTNITSNTEVLHIESGGRMIRFNSSISPTSNYHLYIISDDEIKEGDWYSDGTYINKADTTYSLEVSKHIKAKKIIATTDKSTAKQVYFDGVPTDNYSYVLPQPSQLFIEKYITEYNKGNKIEEVEVEYEPIGNWRHAQFVHTRDIPIIDSNNCISIQSIKDSWSREEVEVLMRKTWRIACSDTDKALFPELEDKFIEENL